MLDYETLRFIWWFIFIFLLVGFAITDGFDMGVTALLPVIGKDNVEKRIMINSIAPHWDGNQVWLITIGGVLFAAWPTVYATVFSGLYIAMILVLVALFFRPVGFEYRAKIDNPAWRKACDAGLFIGGFIPALLFGVLVGNLFQGVPFHFNEINQVRYTGSFFELLNPFALFLGFMSLIMFVMQGATWLQMKTTDELRVKSRKIAILSACILFVIFPLAGLWLYFKDGFVISSDLSHNALSVLKDKEVTIQAGAWFKNYFNYPILFVFPVIGLISSLLVVYASLKDKSWLSFVASSLVQLGIISTAFIAMFPFIVPSISHPQMSLTIWDATASYTTLNMMFLISCVFVPIILGYTVWSYIKMFGRLDTKFIAEKGNSLY